MSSKIGIAMDNEDPPAIKRPRTSEDFYLFCTYILEYENYENKVQEELRKKSTSPMDSVGLVSDSNLSSGQEDNTKTIDDETGQFNNYVDSDSYDLVTCYCNKPFAGRPMIECTNCLTWVHLSCAKIRKKHIPEVFYCIMCKSAGGGNRELELTKSKTELIDIEGGDGAKTTAATTSGCEQIQRVPNKSAIVTTSPAPSIGAVPIMINGTTTTNSINLLKHDFKNIMPLKTTQPSKTYQRNNSLSSSNNVDNNINTTNNPLTPFSNFSANIKLLSPISNNNKSYRAFKITNTNHKSHNTTPTNDLKRLSQL